jgi:hypothetical protein
LPDDAYVNVLPKGNCVHVVFAGDSYVFGGGTCAVGSWGGQRAGLAGYVTVTGPKHGDGTHARGARRRSSFMLPIL